MVFGGSVRWLLWVGCYGLVINFVDEKKIDFCRLCHQIIGGAFKHFFFDFHPYLEFHFKTWFIYNLSGGRCIPEQGKTLSKLHHLLRELMLFEQLSL